MKKTNKERVNTLITRIDNIEKYVSSKNDLDVTDITIRDNMGRSATNVHNLMDSACFGPDERKEIQESIKMVVSAVVVPRLKRNLQAFYDELDSL